MFGDPMPLVFIGPSITVTATFRAVWLFPASEFLLSDIGAQIQP